MNTADVAEELAAVLSTVTGLRVHAWPVGSVVPPAAVVGLPVSVVFDETYGRGVDVVEVQVVAVVGKVTERAARDLLAEYGSGSGDTSFKQALESGSYASCDSVSVKRWESDVYTAGGVDYGAAVFDLEIRGPGSA